MIWQLWWVWAVAGLVLGILEVVIPGFIFLGFASGAVAVGLVLLIGGLFGWVPSALAPLALLFALASLVAWVMLRRLLGVRKGQVRIWDRDINDN